MSHDGRELLSRLGAGESIEALCAEAGWSRDRFDAWWRDECRARVPATTGEIPTAGPLGRVRIRRDRWGIPHVEARDDHDLFFGFGYAIAQDRLFQLDNLRRRAHGRLAEVLGTGALASDVLYRTLDLGRVAEDEWRGLPTGDRDLLSSYAAGVNALIDATRERPPIEFDLLDYRPEPWSPTDSLAVAAEFAWYLTGRFPVIVVPELVRRALGDGPLYRSFLRGEEDGESILPPGSYPASPPRDRVDVGQTVSDAYQGQGSNNWVLSGARTTTGKPLVASDPHVPFGTVSIWHEIHLRGGSLHVMGVSYAGMPAVMIGRTERVAWGLTNNICSLRDLYREEADPDHPGHYRVNGGSEPVHERREVIQVRGGAPVVRTVRSTRNGPLVDDLLPAAASGSGPVSLRWQGAEPSVWLSALMATNRARTAEEFREATRPWRVPTFSLVFADADGQIGYQCTGRIPIRHAAERGYRPGSDPRHEWDGEIPFEGMPRLADPEGGFIVTANNRVAPDDFPHPLSGTWSSGHRARRIRERLESRPLWSVEDCRRLQQDVHSERAAECVPHLVTLLGGCEDSRVQRAVALVSDWDYRVEADSAPAALFNVFFARWCDRVAAERLPSEMAGLAAAGAGGLASALLAGDEVGWFAPDARREAVRATMAVALDEIEARMGTDPTGWSWGRLHALALKHFLSGRGDLGRLLDRGGEPVRGDGTTVCNSSPDANHAAFMGASYRMVADLADPRRGIWAVGLAGASGHPGSPHYADEVADWCAGGYHYLPMDDPGGEEDVDMLVLTPPL